MDSYECIVKILATWNPTTREKTFKYARVISDGVFVVDRIRYNHVIVPATEEEWLQQLEEDKKIAESRKLHPRPIKKGEKILNPWR